MAGSGEGVAADEIGVERKRVSAGPTPKPVSADLGSVCSDVPGCAGVRVTGVRMGTAPPGDCFRILGGDARAAERVTGRDCGDWGFEPDGLDSDEEPDGIRGARSTLNWVNSRGSLGFRSGVPGTVGGLDDSG